eukprot:SAG22_NODE_1555_length_4133_cov_3.586515_3_plen_77_part_00
MLELCCPRQCCLSFLAAQEAELAAGGGGAAGEAAEKAVALEADLAALRTRNEQLELGLCRALEGGAAAAAALDGDR